MAVPKRKHSKARTRSRRANHDRMGLLNLVDCQSCGGERLRHRVCPSCGTYRERVVLEPKFTDDGYETIAD